MSTTGDPKLEQGGGGGGASDAGGSTAGTSGAAGGTPPEGQSFQSRVLGVIVQFVAGIVVGAALNIAQAIDSAVDALAAAIGQGGRAIQTGISAVGGAIGSAWATAVTSVMSAIGVGPNIAGAIVAVGAAVFLLAIGIRFGEALLEAVLVAVGAIPVLGDLIVAAVTFVIELAAGDPG